MRRSLHYEIRATWSDITSDRLTNWECTSAMAPRWFYPCPGDRWAWCTSEGWASRCLVCGRSRAPRPRWCRAHYLIRKYSENYIDGCTYGMQSKFLTLPVLGSNENQLVNLSFFPPLPLDLNLTDVWGIGNTRRDIECECDNILSMRFPDSASRIKECNCNIYII